MGKINIPESEDGAGLIAIERNRQQVECGWTQEHDSWHGDGQLIHNAQCLLEGSADNWGIKEKHPDRIEQLIIAGALIAAEIDQILEARKPSNLDQSAPKHPQ